MIQIDALTYSFYVIPMRDYCRIVFEKIVEWNESCNADRYKTQVSKCEWKEWRVRVDDAQEFP